MKLRLLNYALAFAVGIVALIGCGENNPANGGGKNLDRRLITGANEAWIGVERCSTATNGSRYCARGDYAFFADGTLWYMGGTETGNVKFKYIIGTWSTSGNQLTYLLGVTHPYSVSGNTLTIHSAGFGSDTQIYNKRSGLIILESYNEYVTYQCEKGDLVGNPYCASILSN
jgi:hypothetical protein